MIRSFLKSRLGLGPKSPLVPGAAAPPIDTADASGKRWSLHDLRGRPVVLYFYPADDTPGCTREACSFRDNLASIDAQVLGVSTDAPESHHAFAQKFNLNFPLLADTSGALAERYGVLDGKARRATFLIDREGRIANVWDPVTVAGHTEQVQAALRDLP